MKVYFIIWFVYGILIEKFPCKVFLIKLNISENQGSGKDIIDLKSYIIREKLPINSSGSYNIISKEPDNNDYFVLQRQTGLLKQINNIDRETICKHAGICQMTLLISINSETLKVMINIEDENDNIPQFSMRLMTLSIRENSNIGSELILPTAEDFDSETNNINRYFIKDVNSRENRKSNQYQASKYFNISVNTQNRIKVPCLKLKKEIDRETIESLELILIAEDSGKQQGSCSITISIIDENDNSPQWPTDKISKKVRECDRSGPLVELKAFDRDDNNTSNGQIKYKIKDNSPDRELINRLFYIEGSTLFFSSLQLRETKNHISFSITAVDGGGREKDTTVTIEIEDCNEYPPFIFIDKPTALVKENDRNSKIFIVLTVVDKDRGINSKFTCDLNDTTFFNMKNVGVYNNWTEIQSTVYHIMKIPDTFFDRETLSFYSVLIRCIDLGRPPLTGEKLFSVKIIDENDNSPKFPANEIKFSITENNNIDALIGYVTAVDPDSDENGRLTYQILNNENDYYFSIDNFGKIEAKWKFDREINEIYSFTIMAKDNGKPSLSDTCTVIITILDANDCIPVFKQQFFYQITEGIGQTTINYFLGNVIAEDNDKGENGTVYYTVRQIYNRLNTLKIDGIKGILKIHGVIDREQTASIQAEIVAFDNGWPRLSAVAIVIVDVLDINDNKPKFKYYSLGKININISTDSEIGIELANFEAEDPDSGENGTINYTIISDKIAEENFPFELQNGGYLVLIESLKESDDISRLPKRLTIRASDNGNPPKFESLTVNIRYNQKKKDQKKNLWPSGNKDRFINVKKENYRKSGSTGLTLLYILIGVILVIFIIFLLVLGYKYNSWRFSKNRQLENNNLNLPLNKWSSIQYNSKCNRKSIPAQSNILQKSSDNSNYVDFTQNRAESNYKSVIEELANKRNSFENITPSINGNNSLIRSQDNGIFYKPYSCATNINRFKEGKKNFTSPFYDNSAFNKTKFNQQTLPSSHNQKFPKNERFFTYHPKSTQRNTVSSTFL